MLMTIQEELEYSYYEPLAEASSGKSISYVRDRRTNRIFVKKIRTVYEIGVYRALRETKVRGVPEIVFLAEAGTECLNEEEKIEAESGQKRVLILIEELIDGITLERLLEQRKENCEAYGTGMKQDKLVQMEEISSWMLSLLSLLEHLHGMQPSIVHRDLKPENLMISGDGQLYLVDFNTARHFSGEAERDTRMLGTVGYAAPEQYGFGESDQRTDIYAFGMILNYLLTGCLSRNQISRDVWNPLIVKCLQMDPVNRYQDVCELRRDFTRLLDATGTMERVAKRDTDGLFPDGRGDWRLPGFRGSSPLIRIFAGALYAFLAIVFLGIIMSQMPNGAEKVFREGVLTVAAFVFPILYLGDYHGMQHIFPGSRSRKKYIRIPFLSAWTVVLFLAPLGLSTL